MRIHEIITEGYRDLKSPNVDDADRVLNDVLCDWVMGEHYRHNVQAKLLACSDIARRYSTVNNKFLYRGFNISSEKNDHLRKEGSFTIETPENKPFASWASSLTAVKDFMFGFDDYVIIRKPTVSLDVLINLHQFDRICKPVTTMHGQFEVIVKMPPVMTKKEISWWKVI